MTVKEFLKSKTFRCVIVLLCIALLSGGLLAICNDLLFVSNEERVARTIKSIYNQEIGYTIIECDYSTEDGTIDNVYRLEDGNYLVKATGEKGYKQGTISVWCVAVFENGSFREIKNVSVAGYDKQTLMSKFTKSVLNGYTGDDPFSDVVSGATFSSNALNNALNTVLSYVQTIGGGDHD